MQMQRVVSTEHVLSAELRRSEKLIWWGGRVRVCSLHRETQA